MGVKAIHQPDITQEAISIGQWDAYELEQHHTAEAAFLALKQWMEANKMERLFSKTQLLIAPGYQIRTVEAILTNFHQPQSTLLLLIHAFVGDQWKEIYDYALSHEYRFLSYGDGSLLWKDRR
jgi:S-adenosylmethionine:tRNA ribosyltransferase-isomerase